MKPAPEVKERPPIEVRLTTSVGKERKTAYTRSLGILRFEGSSLLLSKAAAELENLGVRIRHAGDEVAFEGGEAQLAKLLHNGSSLSLKSVTLGNGVISLSPKDKKFEITIRRLTQKELDNPALGVETKPNPHDESLEDLRRLIRRTRADR